MTINHKKDSLFLVSACLVGLATRYDGQTKINEPCLQFLQGKIWIPVCPEQLGGLATPRSPADIVDGDGHAVLDGHAQVITVDGSDVSAQFVAGAKQVLAVARQQNISGVCLKAGSPSCAGHGKQGVTAALLARHGITLYEF